jgi:hypothetical protein
VTVGAALVGLVLGFAAPKASNASPHSYDLKNHPGGEQEYLSCGWHGTCYDPPNATEGWALDWARPTPGAAFGVYWRSKAVTSNPAQWAGTGTIGYIGGGSCTHKAYVSVKDIGGAWRADVWYVHAQTSLAGNSFTIGASTLPVSTSYYLGQAAYEGGGGCNWTGYHVHQASGGGWQNKLSFPHHSTCNAPAVTTDGGVYSAWTYPMLGTSWTR